MGSNFWSNMRRYSRSRFPLMSLRVDNKFFQFLFELCTICTNILQALMNRFQKNVFQNSNLEWISSKMLWVKLEFQLEVDFSSIFYTIPVKYFYSPFCLAKTIFLQDLVKSQFRTKNGSLTQFLQTFGFFATRFTQETVKILKCRS